MRSPRQRWKTFNILALKSLTLSVFLVMIFEVLPTIGEFWYTAKTARSEASDYAHQEALRLTQLASNDHEKIINNVQQLLSVLVEVPEIQQAETKNCSAFLAKLHKQYPLYSNIGLLDVQGNVLCSALPFLSSVNLADRLYFKKALEKKGFAIGEYQVGRITKKATINFGQAMLDEQKNIKGVLFAALDLSWLQQLANTAILPTQGTLMVLDQKGKILVSHPDTKSLVGKEIPDTSLIEIIQSDEDRVHETAAVDGVERMYAFKRLRTASEAGTLYIVVGVPNFVFYSQFERMLASSMTREAFVTFLEILFAWVAGFIFLYQIKKIQKAAKRLKAGDLTARTGLHGGFGELEHLAHTFDDMATNLEVRTQEAETEARRLTFLSQSANTLCSSINYRDTLQKITEGAVLSMADYCYIDILDSKGNFQRIAMSHVVPEKIPFLKTLPYPSQKVKEPTLVPQAPPQAMDSKEKVTPKSLMLIPIKIRNRLIGTITFAYSESNRIYQKNDLVIGEDLAEYIALAFENARLAEQKDDKPL